MFYQFVLNQGKSRIGMMKNYTISQTTPSIYQELTPAYSFYFPSVSLQGPIRFYVVMQHSFGRLNADFSPPIAAGEVW